MRDSIRNAFREHNIRGTVILAEEGYNGMVCGTSQELSSFLEWLGGLLGTTVSAKRSFHDKPPFRRIDVKIKPEIVTLRRPVEISLGEGTHVSPSRWNELISDPDTFVLDTRNDYEYETGTFRGARNPQIKKFSDLPEYVAAELDPSRHKKVAMFCTGGIRCEKFAPYMKQLGFDEVYQLDGGILKYLEEVDPADSLWDGECFVFDERVTVDHSLNRGSGVDRSQRVSSRKDPKYIISE